jgi:hypothetical protein
MLARALALILSVECGGSGIPCPLDGGIQFVGSDAPVVEPSGFIGIRSGMLLADNGQTMFVDGGVWADDATLMREALEKRALRENLKLAEFNQQGEITKWITLGAGIGVGGAALFALLVYVFTSLGK